jgi:beta-1,4-mannosyl-glycoprotein beta-1,4-N-acetylglucosaminyltransferase
MKIYDCFSFYNEFDLLEIRLQELYDQVDYFVISEANTTHSGIPKNFQLLDNWERYKPWADKIIHVKVEDMPGVTEKFRINPDTGKPELWKDCWHNERHQRNCLVRGLSQCSHNDIIIMGDVDEVVRASSVEEVRKDQKHNFWAFRMPMFNYRFNYMWVEPLIYQIQTVAATAQRLVGFDTFSNIREGYGTHVLANRPCVYDDGVDLFLQHAGWHFSSLGNSEFVANKLKSFAHSELAYQADSINVDELIANNKSSLRPNARFEAVILDDYFPKSLLDNRDRYQHLILDGATESAMNKLKDVF